MGLDKHYDFKIVEEGKYENWKNKGYFRAGDISKQKFSMVIPPPNVTGKLHIGHSLDTTIQDITCRYKKAKGFDVLYLPGCDHAGIATQAKVDKRLKEEGISRFDIGREAFLKKAFEWKDEYSDIIHKQWAKMGLMLDYSRERFTLDEGFSKAVYYVFKKLYDEKLIYRGERIVNYDPVMRTALSNIEVIYKEDKGKFYYFKYVFTDNKNKFLTIATTRPETMFGDTCIVVNPKDKRYKDIVGKKVINPANNEEIPVITDEYVDMKFGTGAMKCTPAHDPNDFNIGKKYNQSFKIIMNIDGTMADNTGKYAGMDRYECRDLLVKNIDKDGNLIKIEEIVHQVGHSERSDAVVEPLLSKQWFVKMKPLSESVLKQQESKDKTVFFPKRFEKVLIRWMSNCDDWCISRQLWWGHRIPVYYSKTTDKILISYETPKDSENWVQDEDVLDTWFSSALWPFATLGWPENTDDFKRYYPLDCMSTGYDIIFFWVARMYFQGLHFTKETPFKNVIIHGLVRDSKGRKMSKSLGNGIDPFDVINSYGVDTLRYFLATTASPGMDMRYSEEKLKSVQSYLNKIWNSARYILGILPEDFKPSDIEKNKLNSIDKFILSKLETTINKVTKAMDKYEYGIASTILYNFVYDDFCSFYIEMTKVSLNDKNNYNYGTYFTLIKVLQSVLMMIYPFSPFITEEIYQSLPVHKESIMLESYPNYDKTFINKNVEKKVTLLQQVIENIRSYKVNNKFAPNYKVDLRIKSIIDFNEFYPYVSRFSFATSIEKVDSDVKNSTSIVLNDMTIFILDNVNKEEMKEKLQKDYNNVLQEIKRSEGLLNNPNFVNKAPKAKLDLEKSKYSNYLKLKDEIENKLKTL
ncbi:MAG: valine--tRNA ligase [Bacilli bacterium]